MYDSYRPPTQFSVFPPVIKNLLIINVLFYLAKYVAVATNTVGLGWVLNALALYPPGAPDLGYTIFGTYGPIPGFWPWQLVTYSFLHGGLAHIFFNMLALWMFGVQVENSWGSRRFAIFYFVCVIGAGLLQMIVMWGTPIPTLGASGGIFGVLLAFGMMFPNQYIMMLFPPIPMKAKYFVILYGAIELFTGVTGTEAGVAHFAHLGGMLFGFVLIQYWRGRLPVRPKQTMYW
ncbi:MAG TPA: rhomboid family intramembrane serine protease [Rhodothermales bacterium]|nr:rhomboid family intramembrane serine protease [Rhodothermales bacterium]